jgi:hypothetical protein
MTVRFFAATGFVALLAGTLFSQTICPPQIRWQQTLGGSGSDEAAAILQTPDGGFVIGGTSSSSDDGNKTSPNYGGSDFWLVRLDAQGQKLWEQSYGGSSSDTLSALEQTADGGFILGGTSWSQAGGNKTSPFFGISDFWIVRTDAQGNKLWEKSFGGSGYDTLQTIKPTTNGGFVVGGISDSPANGNKSSPSYGANDFWVLRLDADGNKLWEASFGTEVYDYLYGVTETPDGGLVLGGHSFVRTPNYNTDYHVIRLDPAGNVLWDKFYGGSEADELYALALAANGDILLAGISFSDISGSKTSPRFGSYDWWVLRLDPSGNKLWDQTYGGSDYEYVMQATALPNGGFLLVGASTSPPSGTKTSPRFGNYASDYWLVKIDEAGNQIWDGSFGGTSFDDARAVAPTADGGYVVAGFSYSVNGHKTGPGFGANDIWVLKLNAENPSDCDNDGVPNAQDLCAETAFGALVNTNGCSLDQLCPCGEWLAHSNYVACVTRVSAEFEAAGTITSAQRAELLARAEAAHCPASEVVFGLVHVPIKDTTLNVADGSYVGFQAGTNSSFGASVLLGEVDSGLFIAPDAGVWGYADSSWSVQGQVYGRLRDGSNALVSTVTAAKPNIEVYPVTVDFSPLGAASLTFQYSSNHVLLNEETIDGPAGTFTVNSARYLGPRINPFWRMPDGTIGVLLEFTEPRNSDPWSRGPDYDRVFVRVNAPTQEVDHISRIDVLGGGLESFSFLDEWLGMFRNRHRIIANGVFQGANRTLTIRGQDRYLSSVGTTIGMQDTSRFEVDFLPIALATNDASLSIVAFSTCISEPIASFWCSTEIALVTIRRDSAGSLAVTANFSAETPSPVRVEIFRDGMLAGSCVSEGGALGYLIATNELAPKLINCSFTASTNPPSVSFAFDRVADFVCTNGNQISGTHFRLTPIGLTNSPTFLSSVSLVLTAAPETDSGELPAFTITDERSQIAQRRLSISTTSNDVTLSWSDNTRLFRLESSASLPNGFAPVPNSPDFLDNRHVVVLPKEASGSRFFRLRSESRD